MAHNSDRLPWDALASTLELRRTNPCQHDACNLHARIQPDSRAKLANFVDIFMQKVAEDAAQQRKQYPEEYEVPEGNEVIISDEAATKIESTVRRWHPEVYWPDSDDELETFKQPTTKKLCPHTNESDNCGCVLPYKERKMSAFQRSQVQNDCFKFDVDNRESFRNLKVVESLILHGEMDPVLRSCAYEECQLAKWREHRECDCTQAYFGWRSIYEDAIRMYVILNVIRQFPETWDADGSPIDDYRHLAAYQQAVRSSTESGYRSEIAMFPHRDFLGIEKGQFWWSPRPHDVTRWKHIMRFDANGFQNYQKGLDRFGFPYSDDESDAESHDGSSTKSSNGSNADDDSDDGSADEPEEKDPEEVENMFYTLEFYPLGLMSYDDFLNFEKLLEYRPSPPDIPRVRSLLFHIGLPPEISDRILEYADYAPRGSLPVPGQPLHPQCRQELDRYLEHCWQLVVRCYMLGNELDGRDGMDIESFVREEVKDCLVELFSCRCDGVHDSFCGFDAELTEDFDVVR
ncbi:hypothetical protein FMUND_5136 [Fusarium mundagurra]|uniref:Uncharacterized protein n=1 Tax=Fusarium mundagurra TaxID=1567541 RepID=A0A8H5YWK6_9HYPO|nr:hypothetical protein FMUND_5136 [Fusarium mundagurra]